MPAATFLTKRIRRSSDTATIPPQAAIDAVCQDHDNNLLIHSTSERLWPIIDSFHVAVVLERRRRCHEEGRCEVSCVHP